MIIKSKLPADPTALVLGIIGIVILLLGCCCGLLGPVALALCIIGLVTANKSLREFDLNPDVYSPQSRSNVYAGKVLCIIGIVTSALVVISYLIYFAFFGLALSDGIWDNYKKNNNSFEVQDSH